MIPVLPKIKFTGSNNFLLTAGPCVVENRKVLHEVAAGADGIFLETHPSPGEALSEGANMLDLGHLDKLMFKLSEIRKIIYKLDKK